MPLARTFVLVLLALVGSAVFAPVASAATSTLSISITGQLSLTDTDGGHHDVTITKINAAPNEWLISDMAMTGADITVTGAALLACAEAAPGDDSAFVCNETSGVLRDILVDMGHGNDLVDLTNAGLRTTVFGGDGNDDIRGTDFADPLNGDSSDTIDGGGGNDYIDGGLGEDNLTGAAGADSLYGGGGDDLLNAVNADTDTANSCDMSPSGGTGTPGTADEIYKDAIGDTQAGDCETVNDVGAPTPTPPPPPAPVAPSNTAAPATPTGEIGVGKSIASTHGTWTGTEPITFVTQWERCVENGACVAIPGATSTSYEISSSDVDQQLRFTVQAINAAGTSAVAASARTAPVPKVKSTVVQYASPQKSDPPQAKGSSCRGGEKPVQVKQLFLCYAKAKPIGKNRWELTGDVSINRAFFLNGATATIDLAKHTIDVTGSPLQFGVIDTGGTYRVSFKGTRMYIPDTSKTTFPMEVTNGQLIGNYTIGGIPTKVLNTAGHIADSASFLKVTGYQAERRLAWGGGIRLMDGAVNVTGEITYDYTNTMTNKVKGCATGALPVGGGSSFGELRNACLTYDQPNRLWRLDADATILNSVSAKGSATLQNGGLEAFDMNVAAAASGTGAGKLPMPFGAYLNGGGVNVSGLRSGRPAFGGTLSGGWPYNPSSSRPRSPSSAGFDTTSTPAR